MKTALVSALALLLAHAGCSRSEGHAPEPAAADTADHAAHVLPFIEDDYPRALAEARRRGIPIFVDMWAPWCHTCLSLREYVFDDPAMARLAGRFVWLSIDTERDTKNAAFVAKFPIAAWPTLLVIDPDGERPVLKWPGSATVPELTSLLADAADAVKNKTGGEASAPLAHGDEAAAQGKTDEAIASYRAALAAAAPTWPRRARLVDSLTTQLQQAKDYPACASLARDELPRLAPGTSAANVAITGLTCATSAPKSDASHALADGLAAQIDRLASDTSLPILADDRSGLYEELVSYRKDAGDKDGAHRAAAAWAAFLEQQAVAAKDPAHRTVFDAHRLLAYSELGAWDKARAMLTESERQFPDDYNHPARLAKLSLDTKQYPDGVLAADRALAKAYGPRRLRLYSLKANLLLAEGDKDGARRVLDEAIDAGNRMTLTGGYAKAFDGLKAKRAEL